VAVFNASHFGSCSDLYELLTASETSHVSQTPYSWVGTSSPQTADCY